MDRTAVTWVLALVLLSGCGGGNSSNSVREPLKPLSTSMAQDSRVDALLIAQNLRNAGYTNASNITKVGMDVIAFTYLNEGKKHFVIYNSKTGQVLSDIPAFIGDTLKAQTKDTVSFNNGTTVNISNYKKPIIATQPATTNYHTSTPKKRAPTSPIEVLKNRYGSGLEKFIYTPAKQGAAVVISTPGGRGLYLYGLENPSNPVREYAIFESDDDDHITDVRMLGNGVLEYTYYSVYSPDKLITVRYNYFDKYEIYNNYAQVYNNNDSDEDSYDSSYNNDHNSYQTKSLSQQFKDDIDNFKWYYVSHALSPQGHGAVVLAQSDDGGSVIYLYGISNGVATREKKLVDEYGTISNLRMLSGGRFSYQIRGETIVSSYL